MLSTFQEACFTMVVSDAPPYLTLHFSQRFQTEPRGGSVSMKINCFFELWAVKFLSSRFLPRRFLPPWGGGGRAAGCLLSRLVLAAGGYHGACYTASEENVFSQRRVIIQSLRRAPCTVWIEVPGGRIVGRFKKIFICIWREQKSFSNNM